MKKILLFAAALLLLSSCGVKYPYNRYSSAIDFSAITRGSNFFITESNSVSFDYKPLGSVSSSVKSGYEVIKGEQKSRPEGYSFRELAKLKFGDYKYATADAAIEELISASKKLGANGIINLKIIYTPAVYDKNGNIISPSSYYTTGMAIDKK